jgi:MoxR-like ATPase
MEKKVEEIKVSWREPLVIKDNVDPLIPDRLLKIMNTEVAVVYQANTGIGKTTSIINYSAKNNYSIFVQECSNDMLASDLTGKWGIQNGDTVYLASEITSAFRLSYQYGEEYKSLSPEDQAKTPKKMVMLLLDEFNLLPPAVMKGIGSVFDTRKYINTDVGRVYANSDHLIIVGTMNAETDSAGFALDPAIRSKFIIVTVSVEDVINTIAKTYSLPNELVELVKRSNTLFSIREIEQLVLLSVEKGFSVRESLDILLGKYEEEQRKYLNNLITSLKVA